MSATEMQVFARPREVQDISECYFYHVMDLPGYGVVGKEWDLRGREDAYLGRVAFRGKRVLELGTASGYLCRYMESQGAQVIGFDLSPEGSWDLVPFAGLDIDSLRCQMKDHIGRLNNGWWFTRRLFESSAQVVYGSIYDIHPEIGPVDIATFGAILMHLRDPFLALYNALRLTRETVIVTDVHPVQPAGSSLDRASQGSSRIGLTKRLKRLGRSAVRRLSSNSSPVMYFAPDFRKPDPNTAVTWWSLTPEVICGFLGVLGFEQTSVTEHSQIFQGGEARMYTVVGTRTREFREP